MDCTQWKTRVARGCRPVVRQRIEWMNGKKEIYPCLCRTFFGSMQAERDRFIVWSSSVPPSNLYLYTVKNIINHDLFFTPVFDVKSIVIKVLSATAYWILITSIKSVVKKEKSLYMIHEVTNDIQAGESGIDTRTINLCHNRRVLEMHHILSNSCFGISQVLWSL